MPEISVTVHVTVVLPNGNAFGLSLVIDLTPTLSDVISSPSLIWFIIGSIASAVISSGIIIVGAVVSSTVIV